MPHVLLVEDDPLIIRLYTRILQLNNFAVEKAENGKAALEILQTFKPDIILLDIMMPEMNGVQFLAHIAAGTEENKIPVIVLTNIVDPVVKAEAAANGASLVIVKSETEPDDVVTSVRQVLDKEILQVEQLESLDAPDEASVPQ